jgi:hypothetical protein
MQNWTIQFGFIAILVYGYNSLQAQNLYISGYYFPSNGNPSYILGVYDIETCTFCPEFTIPIASFPGVMEDVVPLPNGQVVVIGSNTAGVYDPPGNSPLASLDFPGITGLSGGVLAPNGNVYITALIQDANGIWDSKVYEYNPVNNTATVVGTLPAPSNEQLFQPFYWNGLLHAFMRDVTNDANYLVTIDLGNPMVFNIVSSLGSGSFCGAPVASITSGPFAGIYGGILDPDCSGVDLYEMEFPANTIEFVCDISPPGYPHGLGETPPGYPSYDCLCLTDAGSVSTPNQILCAGQTLNFTNTGGFLESNDIKEYILFTNPNDTLGSIVLTSSTPSFDFEPPLQAGVTYYFAAMAGDELNGGVDPDDPCLDFSNARTVIWRPLPTVALSVGNGDVCAGDCRTINATFNGTAPFTLTYTTPNGGPVTQTFSSNTGTFQVCVPANAPVGGITVQATALTDAWCACN